MSELYLQHQAAKASFEVASPFSPSIPVASLPYLAAILLLATFNLGFYFSTLPKPSVPTAELSVALIASLLGGFGVVALFCSVGVYV
ncbi:hypothetical protein BDV98DRAFT_561107 [Pterulicium gracile]|uniref:Dolichyl-diphosphooligosaccharide-protein glycosyltransferase subunit OST5 n=1 Tax=Pterulicium gracile TaxID=1884261 RepID=A0A5C3R0E9_9AGAR|nr:hypothetical protein BDV98DRAFT_561107 [Pterula gracilis]